MGAGVHLARFGAPWQTTIRASNLPALGQAPGRRQSPAPSRAIRRTGRRRAPESPACPSPHHRSWRVMVGRLRQSKIPPGRVSRRTPALRRPRRTRWCHRVSKRPRASAVAIPITLRIRERKRSRRGPKRTPNPMMALGKTRSIIPRLRTIPQEGPTRHSQAPPTTAIRTTRLLAKQRKQASAAQRKATLTTENLSMLRSRNPQRRQPPRWPRPSPTRTATPGRTTTTIPGLWMVRKE